MTFDLGSGNLGGPCVIAIAQQVSQIPPGGWATSAVLNANCGQDTFTASSGSFESSACSCDPNDKAVWPPGCDAAGTIETAQALDYTVRFQNLGLGPAHTVFVTDAIDPDLDIESLVLTYSDQDITSLQIDEDRRLIVRYDDIEPPAAIDDLAGSMGRFHYRIEPAVTEVGSVYTNEANIYFDQNEVVITNQVSTTIGECPDIPPGLWSLGPSKSGITNGTNPGKGKGTSRNPSGGIQPNPNNAP